MPKRHLSRVLPALACWLIVLASGDDINFARVVLDPFLDVAEDVLPLDDPNADFTPPSESRCPRTADRRPPGSVAANGRRGAASPVSLGYDHPSHPCLHVPLRC